MTIKGVVQGIVDRIQGQAAAVEVPKPAAVGDPNPFAALVEVILHAALVAV